MSLPFASEKDVLKFACKECGKKFFVKAELTSHMMFKHSDERPFACDLCKKTFKHQKDLRRHTATLHSEKRDYQCTGMCLICDIELKGKKLSKENCNIRLM